MVRHSTVVRFYQTTVLLAALCVGLVYERMKSQEGPSLMVEHNIKRYEKITSDKKKTDSELADKIKKDLLTSKK